MAYKITDACVKCGACADACPMGIITEGDDKYVIDADQCVDCGTCADTCPNEAIVEAYVLSLPGLSQSPFESAPSFIL